MQDINISKIKYIGVHDNDIDLFESQYVVPEGISYNSYVILDEKVAIMDTIDQRKSAEWLTNLEKALDGRTPDYLVVHHLEPDHSANIAAVVAKYPDIQVVASAKAVTMLPQFFEDTNFENRTITIVENDKLPLGECTLQFFMAPMVHWPEVMVSYESHNKVLFAADGFGKFGAMNFEDEWRDEARRYYFNICGKYGVQVQMLLQKAATLDIEYILPLHGPVLHENLGYYIGLYDTWSKYEAEMDGILVAYASIHGGTAKVAQLMVKMLEERGVKNVVAIDLTRADVSEAVSQAFKMSKMLLAASSYDAGVFSPMYDFLHRLQIKCYQNRTVAMIENGSWAPAAGRTMKAMLEPMKRITLIEPMVTIKSRMKRTDIPALETLADQLVK